MRYLLIVLLALCLAGSAMAATVNVPADNAAIQAAINAANPGDTINIAAGTCVITSTINVNKSVNLIGAGNASTIFKVSGNSNAIKMMASGSSLQDVQIEKIDKASPQDIIYIQATNVKILHNIIWGKWVMTDTSDVSRAMVISYGCSGLQIQGNTIYALRQPAYINGSVAAPTTGNIVDNYVGGTKGWVIDGANMTFLGNKWGTGSSANVIDVAILASTSPTYYTNIGDIYANNNFPKIDDQRNLAATYSVTPKMLNAANCSFGTDFVGPKGALVPNTPSAAFGAPTDFGTSSFAATVAMNSAIESERYKTLRINVPALFPRKASLLISDIKSISYYSNKDVNATIDWRFNVYTVPTGSGDYSWFHSRIESNIPVGSPNTWNKWSTDAGSNQLLFIINRTGALVYDAPWSAVTTSTNASDKVWFMDFIMGANTGGGNGTSKLDAIRIELTDGEAAVLDLGGNTLSLASSSNPLYVKSGDSVAVDLNVSDLAQKVTGCQTYIGYDNTFFSDPTAGCVQAGGGTWNDLIWDSWTKPSPVSGAINAVIGIEADAGSAGTQADAKVATITLTTKAEGVTNLYFLNDESDMAGNYLSDTSIPAIAINPTLLNGTQIVVDSTAPVITDNSNLPAETDKATVTVKATVADAISGVKSFTLNGVAFDGEEPVVLTPGANTITLAATDNCGNEATKIISITYNQPAPQIALTASLAPNVYGSSTFNTWAANAVSAILAGDTSNGSSYAKYEDLGFTDTLDFSTCMVSEGFSTWLGMADASHELGTAVHFCYKIDNGVVGNSGAAKLDLANVTGTYRYNYIGMAQDDFDSYAALAGKAFGQNSWLKGYNYVDGSWVEVTSGTKADVIICVKNRVGMASKPDQASLNKLYAEMSGAVPDSKGVTYTFTSVNYGITYSGQANVGVANTGVKDLKFGPVNDKTAPAIAGPADGEIFTSSTTITVTDLPVDLASGVKTVTINGTAATVANGACTATVNLNRGANTINVVAVDYAGNTSSKTFNVFYVANRISGQVELDRFVGTTRVVSFYVNGAKVNANAVTLVEVGNFSSAVATFTLTNVDGLKTDGNKLSAQTAWNLRSTVSFSLTNNIATGVTFTGADKLLGGDLNGSNTINVLDYGTLKSCWYTTNPIGDVNGDGKVDAIDYGIQKDNWFKAGDNF